MKNLELLNSLEQSVDAFGLRNVLAELQGVCNLKAEHLRSNWQDGPSAKEWEYVARTLNTPIKHAEHRHI
jgi:hypothetical protein